MALPPADTSPLLPRHGVFPLLNAAGYRITRHGQSWSRYDLQVTAANGDSVIVEDIALSEAQAFIKCLDRMLLHTAPRAAVRQYELDDPDEPGADAAATPPRGPEPGAPPSATAAHEPYASGGFIPPAGACMRGEWVLPAAGVTATAQKPFPSGGWVGTPTGSPVNWALTACAAAATPVLFPLTMTLYGDELVLEGGLLFCTCGTITGGLRADNPACPVHHGPQPAPQFPPR